MVRSLKNTGYAIQYNTFQDSAFFFFSYRIDGALAHLFLKFPKHVTYLKKINDNYDKWYFVTKIVLTYCEKKFVLVIVKNVCNLRLKAKNLQLEQFIQAVKGQKLVS